MRYPVHFEATQPARYSRLQLALRVLAVIALATVGVSAGSVFCLFYLGLPVVAAVRISTHGSCNDYAEKDGPRILFALRWLAALTTWVHLGVDRLPSESPDETIRLTIEGRPGQTPGSAALRVLLGLPSLLVLAILSFVGALAWLWAAVTILLSETVPRSAWVYLIGVERYTYRLLAYQAALVDEYPPFALSEDHAVARAQTSA